jgi:hypothetical protein
MGIKMQHVITICIIVFMCTPITILMFSTAAIHPKKLINNPYKYSKYIFETTDVWDIPGMAAVTLSPLKHKLLSMEDNLTMADTMHRLNVTADDVTLLCGRFGFKPLPSGTPLPRIFYGVIFDKEIDLLHMALYEMLDLLHR